MMGMSDGDRQCVRSVRPGNHRAGQQPRYHRMHLILAGIADADDRLLDQPRRIFANLYSRSCRVQKADAARLSQLQCRLWIGVDEDFLDRCRTWPMLEDEVRQGGVQRQQPRRQRSLTVRLDLPIADVAQPVAVDGDQTPACRPKAGVKPKQDQPSFSMTSSDTS
jgi:hypothetical protein